MAAGTRGFRCRLCRGEVVIGAEDIEDNPYENPSRQRKDLSDVVGFERLSPFLLHPFTTNRSSDLPSRLVVGIPFHRSEASKLPRVSPRRAVAIGGRRTIRVL